MSLWQWLFGSAATPHDAGETETVRRIVTEVESLPAERARYVAAFAYIISRVARADLHVSPSERDMMEHLVEEYGELPSQQARLVVEIAVHQNELLGGTENFLVTREFKQLSTRDQRQHMLLCLFAVAAADDVISAVEEEQIRRIATELGFSHEDFVRMRTAYNDKREVVRSLREKH